MNLPAFPPKCRSRRKRLPSHLTSSGGTVRAAGYRKPLGALGSEIVKLQALEEELLNGLHDALLRAISLDVVGQTAEIQLDICVGDPDGETEAAREAYRPARIRLSGLVYLIVDPPGPGYTSLLGSPLRIDLCDADPDVASLRAISQGELAARIFVSEWNSFIHFAAGDVDLQWLT
jgi:hypothetical protein